MVTMVSMPCNLSEHGPCMPADPMSFTMLPCFNNSVTATCHLHGVCARNRPALWMHERPVSRAQCMHMSTMHGVQCIHMRLLALSNQRMFYVMHIPKSFCPQKTGRRYRTNSHTNKRALQRTPHTRPRSLAPTFHTPQHLQTTTHSRSQMTTAALLAQLNLARVGWLLLAGWTH